MTFMRDFDEDYINKVYARVFNVKKDHESGSKETEPYAHMSRISWIEAIEILKKEGGLKQ